MKQSAIQIAGSTIQAGEYQNIQLPLPKLYTNTHLDMPISVVHGKQAGPRLFISAAIHGDEINGVEIIRRLLLNKLLRNLHGTLIAIPVVNVFGFLDKTRYLPDRRDLNRSFPGSADGSLAAQLAHLFLREIVQQCTHGIDLHTAAIGRTNLPQLRVDLKQHPELKPLADVFNAPVILNTGLRDGTLRATASQLGIPILLYEAGEALRFEEYPIRVGVQGILAVMRHLGMLPSNKPQKPQHPLLSHRSKWVRAPQSGILRDACPMGKIVSVGDILGYIGDPFGEITVPVLANQSGVIIGRSTLPLVLKGEAIFHIAEIKDSDYSDYSTLATAQHEMDPDTERPFY